MQILKIPKKKRIYAIAFSPSGRDLAAVCGDGVIRIWNTSTGELRQFAGVEAVSYGFALLYLSDDSILFAGRDLSTWALARNEWTMIIPGMRFGRKIALSPDGRWLADVDSTQSIDGLFEQQIAGLALVDMNEGTMLPARADAANTSGGAAFNLDGRHLATSHIVRVGTKHRSFGLTFGPYPVNDYDYVVHVREMPTGRILQSIPDWGQGVTNLAFSPDGAVLAGTAGPRLRVWDLANDRELALHKRGPKHFQDLSFTADGRYLATVSNDETVRLWDARTWEEKTTFTWQIGKLLNIAFAPDGLRAAAGSDKGQIVIWDVEG